MSHKHVASPSIDFSNNIQPSNRVNLKSKGRNPFAESEDVPLENN